MPEVIDKSNDIRNLTQIPASRGGNSIEWIVIHYLGVPNADNEYLHGGGYGGHYYVSRAGQVYKAADPRTVVTWHCGGGLQGYDAGSATYHGICTNYNSIGIENGVCYDTDWYFTTETQESLVWLVNNLMAEYGIDKNHVIRHWDVTGKNCPVPYVANNRHNTSWTWDEFKSRLGRVGYSSGDSGKGDYVAWAVNIANDDRYYYDHSYDPFSFSCSTLVAKALYETGYFSRDIVPPDGSAIGGEGDSTLHNELRSAGFVEMSYNECGGFRRGDIFTIGPNYHIAIYVGDGQCVAANGGGATKADDILVYSVATFPGYVTVFRHPQYSQGSSYLPSSSDTSSSAFGGISPSGLLHPTPLYTTSSTRADAMMREVCYLGANGEPSINKTDIKLSVINYTDLLAEFYGLFGVTSSTIVGYGYATTETTVDNVDKLRTVHRYIVRFLWEKGFNTAVAIGIIANLEDDTGCKTDYTKDNVEFGICRWTWARAVRMKSYCSNSWKSNLTGQLEYMMSELETSYPSLLESLQNVENTETGANEAMRLFYNRYIRRDTPKRLSRTFDYSVRGNIVSTLWKDVIIGQTIYSYTYGESGSGTSVTPTGSQTYSSENARIVGRIAVKTVVVPSILGGSWTEQTGLIGDTTKFDEFFDSWSYTCRIIADRWHAQGRPSSHHVCMLDGYYLVAVAPMFGSTGDLIEIVLEDGTTLNCICGDTKGSDRQSDYGHVFGDKVSIVEWESCNLQTVSAGTEMNRYLTEWGIYKKKVKQITNYGVYIS